MSSNRVPDWAPTLAQVQPRPEAGLWFRIVPRIYREWIDSDEGAKRRGGRYNPPDEFGALYLSANPEGCLAELATRTDTPPNLCEGTIEVRLDRVCDLTDQATREILGVALTDLTGPDWTLTQQLGSAIRDAGFQGIRVPSAVGPHINLVVFRDRAAPEAVAIRTVRDL